MDSAADQDLGNLPDEELADCSFKRRELPQLKLEKTTTPFGDLKTGAKGLDNLLKTSSASCETAKGVHPGLASELDAAATMLQKAYKSYRTRRNLADCAVFIEELWWKALDFSALRRSSISFFDSDRSETAASRWLRARTRAAKVGKGLSKDEKAQQLALRHWLEAIDPRHRYGHNLHFYYDVWFDSESSQPFFYWLDVGDGKEVHLKSCPRTQLQRQCIKYLGPKQRGAYEVVVKDGKLVFKQTGVPVSTIEGTKWIFVLSASRNIYVGQKEKGSFQHSSFLAGGAAIAAGRIVARNGLLEAIWSYSGHYRFGEENFVEFLNFLEEQKVDLRQVKKYPTDDDIPPSKVTAEKPELDSMGNTSKNTLPTKVRDNNVIGHPEAISVAAIDNGHPMASMHVCARQDDHDKDKKVENAPPGQLSSGKWTTGAGPRIGCVREYPAALQLEALQRLNLSPRAKPGISMSHSGPIPSPRPSSKVHLSPRLLFLGLASPKVQLSNGKPIRHAGLING